MPLPLVLGVVAAIAAAGGLGTGAYGSVKIKDASDTAKHTEDRHNKNFSRFELCNSRAAETMDALGIQELDILTSFQKFSELFEQIQNRPVFEEFSVGTIELPYYDEEEISKVSVGAGILMGGIGGAVLGTAGGFAAAGATTAAVMALGTASTGTAIATLSGAAATNATLAALGGGAIAVGGGGIALGTTMLGITTAGAGLLIGGIIFSIAGSTLSNKTKKAYEEMLDAEKEINKICTYLNELNRVAKQYTHTLESVDSIYRRHFHILDEIINVNKKTDWNEFTKQERLATENTVLLVQLLYKMCQVQVVLVSEDKNSLNTVNRTDVENNISVAHTVLFERGFVSDEPKLNAEIFLDEQEAEYLALVALLYYFANCDGVISEEEETIIEDSIHSIVGDFNKSDTLLLETENIKTTNTVDFDFLPEYLDKTSISFLDEVSALVEQVCGASEGITKAEKSAKKRFEKYVETRKNN